MNTKKILAFMPLFLILLPLSFPDNLCAFGEKALRIETLSIKQSSNTKVEIEDFINRIKKSYYNRRNPGKLFLKHAQAKTLPKALEVLRFSLKFALGSVNSINLDSVKPWLEGLLGEIVKSPDWDPPPYFWDKMHQLLEESKTWLLNKGDVDQWLLEIELKPLFEWYQAAFLAKKMNIILEVPEPEISIIYSPKDLIAELPKIRDYFGPTISSMDKPLKLFIQWGKEFDGEAWPTQIVLYLAEASGEETIINYETNKNPGYRRGTFGHEVLHWLHYNKQNGMHLISLEGWKQLIQDGQFTYFSREKKLIPVEIFFQELNSFEEGEAIEKILNSKNHQWVIRQNGNLVNYLYPSLAELVDKRVVLKNNGFYTLPVNYNGSEIDLDFKVELGLSSSFSSPMEMIARIGELYYENDGNLEKTIRLFKGLRSHFSEEILEQMVRTTLDVIKPFFNHRRNGVLNGKIFLGSS